MRPKHGGNVTPSLLDFSVNLNPYADSPDDETWLSWKNHIQHYPSPTPDRCDKLLSQTLEIPQSNTLTTQGGIEAIRLALEGIKPNKVVIPAPCFSEYSFICQQLDLAYEHQAISKQDWFHDQNWLPEIKCDEPVAVIFANPNNPTGISLNADVLLDHIQQHEKQPITWIIDEAFIHFCKNPDKISLLQYAQTSGNIIICGSLTKSWNIPGLRLGYLSCSNTEWMNRFRALQSTWAIHSLAEPWMQYSFTEVNQHKQNQAIQKVIAERDQLYQALKKISFIEPVRSDTNYILCELKELCSATLIKKLTDNQIAVRSCESIPGIPSADFIRIGVKRSAENQKLISVLEKFA